MVSSNIATVHGKARHLLLGKCVSLNILTQCSGMSPRVSSEWASSCGQGIVMPLHLTCSKFYRGFPPVEKYGMLVGGIDPHLFDLSSMLILKENHVWSAGGLSFVPNFRDFSPL